MNKYFISSKIWFVRQSAMKKWFLLGLLAFILWFGGTKFFGQKTTTPQYQTASVEKGTLITSVTASGTIASGNSVNITTSATGFVHTLYVKNGDTVVQGQNIAAITLDQESLQKQTAAWASYLSAQNSLHSAKSKMNSLQAALFKANQAFVTGKGIGSPSDAQKADPTYIQENANWLQAESDYTNQAGVIAQVEASLSSAWLLYQQLASVVTSPISGKITNLTISEGYPLSSSSLNASSTNSSTTSSSQSLGNIALDNGKLQASVNLSEIDVTKVKIGQKVTMVLDAFADKTFTGHVAAIDTNGSVSSGVTTYPAIIAFDSSLATMYPNMGVSATIITNVKDNVLLVPSAAVQAQNGAATVRVLKNGQVQTVDVTTGDASDTQTEIVSGLSEGDMVVTGTISTAASTGRTSTSASPFGGGGLGGNVRVLNAGGGGTTRGGAAAGR